MRNCHGERRRVSGLLPDQPKTLKLFLHRPSDSSVDVAIRRFRSALHARSHP